MEFVGENYEVKKRYFSCGNANKQKIILIYNIL